MSNSINKEKLDSLKVLYKQELSVSVAKEPNEYWLNIGETPEQYAERVGEKMFSVIEKEGWYGVSIDSPTFKRLAKRIGIKHGYKHFIEYTKA